MNNLSGNSGITVALFRSKWQPPEKVAHLFRRERPLRQLEAGWQRKLTTVTAPAGYGKTTLLRAWASQQQQMVGWLRLDSSDNELAKFLCYMIRAFPLLSVEFQDTCTERVMQADPARLPAALETIASAWIQALEQEERQMMIILDGFEHIRDPDILRFVTLLLRFSPSHVHFVLSGRQTQGIGAQGGNVGGIGEVGAIVTQDLALTQEELYLYVIHHTAVRLSESELRELAERTQGWLIGIQAYLPLIREHGGFRSDARLHDLAERGVTAYFHHFVRSETTPAELRALMCYSVARSLNAELASRLSEGLAEKVALSAIVQHAWFMSPHQQMPGTYRFHPMFASYLRAQLREDDPEAYARLLLRCSVYEEEEGRNLQAADYALIGGERQLAADLLQQASPDQLRAGDLLSTLARFTNAELIRWPTLAVLYANALLHARRIHAAESMIGLLTSVVAANPDATLSTTGERMSGYIAGLQSMAHFSKGETELGRFYMEQTGRELNGPGLLHRSLLHMNPYMAPILRGKYGHYGMLKSALTTFEYCVTRWGAQDAAYAVILIGLGECYYELGKPDLAEPRLNQGLRLGLDLNIPEIFVPAYLAWAQLKWRNGEKEAAWNALREAREQLYKRKLGSKAAVIDACEIKLRIWDHDIKTVRRWVRLPSVQPEEPLSHDRMYESIIFLRACIFIGNLADALTFGEKLLLTALSVDHPRDLIEIHLLLAQVHIKQGDMKLALDKVDVALREACVQGYVQMIVDEGAAAFLLLNEYRKRLRRQSGSELRKFIDSVIRMMPGGVRLEVEIAPATIRLTRQEKRIYAMLLQNASNQAIADELLISTETVKKHCRQVYRKLGVTNRKMAIQKMKQPQTVNEKA